MSWTPSPLANVLYASTPVLRVKAVDPTNPDVVYMASEGANPPAGDRLYRSSDGGVTWTEVLVTTSPIHDVLIYDAQQLFVTTQIKTATSIMGGPAFHSTDAGASFTDLVGAPQLACLAKRADGVLFGCAANWGPDWKAVAKSTDGGVTWEKVWRFVELAGAVQCPAGTVEHDTCDVTLWDCPTCESDLKRQFGAKGPSCGVLATDPPAPPPKKDGCCDAGTGAQTSLLWIVVVAWWLKRRR